MQKQFALPKRSRANPEHNNKRRCPQCAGHMRHYAAGMDAKTHAVIGSKFGCEKCEDFFELAGLRNGKAHYEKAQGTPAEVRRLKVQATRLAERKTLATGRALDLGSGGAAKLDV